MPARKPKRRGRVQSVDQVIPKGTSLNGPSLRSQSADRVGISLNGPLPRPLPVRRPVSVVNKPPSPPKVTEKVKRPLPKPPPKGRPKISEKVKRPPPVRRSVKNKPKTPNEVNRDSPKDSPNSPNVSYPGRPRFFIPIKETDPYPQNRPQNGPRTRLYPRGSVRINWSKNRA